MKKVKVLYISCHEGLEYDEVKLLSQIENIEVRSCGAYVDPSGGCALRPPITTLRVPPAAHIAASGRFNVEDHVLNDDLLKWADVVIFMHMPEWIHKSLDVLDRYKSIRIIYRSIGQSSPSVESMLLNYTRHFGDRFTIVRYSPNEKSLQGYTKSSHLIRFAKDLEEFKGWQLVDKNLRSVMLAAQNGLGRGNFTHVRESIDALGSLPKFLVGPSNEEAASLLPISAPAYDQWKNVLGLAPLLFYTGTVPASYTLTPIEAMMTGTPIVSISGDMWNNEHVGWCPQALFEVPEMVGAPFTVFSWDEVHDLVKEIMYDDTLLQAMSKANRQTAIALFDSNSIAKQWSALLNG